MNRMLCAIVAPFLFALTPALFGGEVEVTVDTGNITLSIGGTTDSTLTIKNLDTNQVVVSVTAYTLNGSSYGTNYVYWGETYISGVSVTSHEPYGQSYAEVSGLPPGDYRVTATSPGLSTFSSNSWGTYGEITLYDPVFWWGWMDIAISAQ